VVTTDAELPQLADVLMEALGTTANGALSADAIFGRFSRPLGDALVAAGLQKAFFLYKAHVI
jgi:hypothetical protein